LTIVLNYQAEPSFYFEGLVLIKKLAVLLLLIIDFWLKLLDVTVDVDDVDVEYDDVVALDVEL